MKADGTKTRGLAVLFGVVILLAPVVVNAQEAEEGERDPVEGKLEAAREKIVSGEIDAGLKIVDELKQLGRPQVRARVGFLEELAEAAKAEAAGDSITAERVLRKAVGSAQTPEDLVACLRVAGRLVRRLTAENAQPEELIDFLNTAAVNDAKTITPHVQLAFLWFSAGNMQKGEAELVRAAELEGTDEAWESWASGVWRLASREEAAADVLAVYKRLAPLAKNEVAKKALVGRFLAGARALLNARNTERSTAIVEGMKTDADDIAELRPVLQLYGHMKSAYESADAGDFTASLKEMQAGYDLVKGRPAEALDVYRQATLLIRDRIRNKDKDTALKLVVFAHSGPGTEVDPWTLHSNMARFYASLDDLPKAEAALQRAAAEAEPASRWVTWSNDALYVLSRCKTEEDKLSLLQRLLPHATSEKSKVASETLVRSFMHRVRADLSVFYHVRNVARGTTTLKALKPHLAGLPKLARSVKVLEHMASAQARLAGNDRDGALKSLVAAHQLAVANTDEVKALFNEARYFMRESLRVKDKDSAARCLEFMAKGPANSIGPAQRHTIMAGYRASLGKPALAEEELRRAIPHLKTDSDWSAWSESALLTIGRARAGEERVAVLKRLRPLVTSEAARETMVKRLIRHAIIDLRGPSCKRGQALFEALSDYGTGLPSVASSLKVAECMVSVHVLSGQGNHAGAIQALLEAREAARREKSATAHVFSLTIYLIRQRLAAKDRLTGEKLMAVLAETDWEGVSPYTRHRNRAELLMSCGKMNAATNALVAAAAGARTEGEWNGLAGYASALLVRTKSLEEQAAAVERLVGGKRPDESEKARTQVARAAVGIVRTKLSAWDVSEADVKGAATLLRAIQRSAAGLPEVGPGVKVVQQMLVAHERHRASDPKAAAAALGRGLELAKQPAEVKSLSDAAGFFMRQYSSAGNQRALAVFASLLSRQIGKQRGKPDFAACSSLVGVQRQLGKWEAVEQMLGRMAAACRTEANWQGWVSEVLMLSRAKAKTPVAQMTFCDGMVSSTKSTTAQALMTLRWLSEARSLLTGTDVGQGQSLVAAIRKKPMVTPEAAAGLKLVVQMASAHAQAKAGEHEGALESLQAAYRLARGKKPAALDVFKETHYLMGQRVAAKDPRAAKGLATFMSSGPGREVDPWLLRTSLAEYKASVGDHEGAFAELQSAYELAKGNPGQALTLFRASAALVQQRRLAKDTVMVDRLLAFMDGKLGKEVPSYARYMSFVQLQRSLGNLTAAAEALVNMGAAAQTVGEWNTWSRYVSAFLPTLTTARDQVDAFERMSGLTGPNEARKARETLAGCMLGIVGRKLSRWTVREADVQDAGLVLQIVEEHAGRIPSVEKQIQAGRWLLSAHRAVLTGDPQAALSALRKAYGNASDGGVTGADVYGAGAYFVRTLAANKSYPAAVEMVLFLHAGPGADREPKTWVELIWSMVKPDTPTEDCLLLCERLVPLASSPETKLLMLEKLLTKVRVDLSQQYEGKHMDRGRAIFNVLKGDAAKLPELTTRVKTLEQMIAAIERSGAGDASGAVEALRAACRPAREWPGAIDDLISETNCLIRKQLGAGAPDAATALGRFLTDDLVASLADSGPGDYKTTTQLLRRLRKWKAAEALTGKMASLCKTEADWDVWAGEVLSLARARSTSPKRQLEVFNRVGSTAETPEAGRALAISKIKLLGAHGRVPPDVLDEVTAVFADSRVGAEAARLRLAATSDPHAADAFVMTAVEGHAGSEVSRRLMRAYLDALRRQEILLLGKALAAVDEGGRVAGAGTAEQAAQELVNAVVKTYQGQASGNAAVPPEALEVCVGMSEELFCLKQYADSVHLGFASLHKAGILPKNLLTGAPLQSPTEIAELKDPNVTRAVGAYLAALARHELGDPRGCERNLQQVAGTGVLPPKLEACVLLLRARRATSDGDYRTAESEIQKARTVLPQSTVLVSVQTEIHKARTEASRRQGVRQQIAQHLKAAAAAQAPDAAIARYRAAAALYLTLGCTEQAVGTHLAVVKRFGDHHAAPASLAACIKILSRPNQVSQQDRIAAFRKKLTDRYPQSPEAKACRSDGAPQP